MHIAVAGWNVIDEQPRRIVCINSWGNNQIHKYLSEKECVQAFLMDVTVNTLRSGSKEMPVPTPSKNYRHMLDRSWVEKVELEQLRKQVAKLLRKQVAKLLEANGRVRSALGNSSVQSLVNIILKPVMEQLRNEVQIQRSCAHAVLAI